MGPPIAAFLRGKGGVAIKFLLSACSTTAGGRLTTIEGLVQEATIKLHDGNKHRKAQLAHLEREEARLQGEGKTLDAAVKERGQQETVIAERIDQIVKQLVRCADGSGLPFSITLSDPAGSAPPPHMPCP